MGMKSPAKKKEIVKRSRPTDAELGKIDSNNGDAGKIISDLTAGHKSIEYEARDIALYDIRVNADNEISGRQIPKRILCSWRRIFSATA